MKNFIVLLSCILFIVSLNAQQTLRFENSKPAKASIDQVSWISGDWSGEAFGGTFEESWNPPSANSMLGMFKQFNNNEISFYELLTISEENESLVLRLKHFDSQLNAWEEKDEKLECKLVKISSGAVYFEGYSFFKISQDQIKCVVLIEGEEIEFLFNRKT